MTEVSKTFGGKVLPFIRSRPVTRVLEDVSFELASHEITVVRGPNGSGKTTLLKMIAGLVSPDAGPGRIQLAPGARVGFSSGEERSLYGRLTARENLEFFAALYGESPKVATRHAQDLLAGLDLEDHAQKSVQLLSSGQKQRLLVARALIGHPGIVILDEPTSRMDDAATEAVWSLLRAHADGGTTIILASHRSEDAARADRTLSVGDRRVISSAGQPSGSHAVPSREENTSRLSSSRRGAPNLWWLSAFVKRDFTTVRSYPLGLLFQLLSVGVSGIVFFFLSHVIGPHARYLQSYGGGYFPFLILGLIALNLQITPLVSFTGAVRQGQLVGTLEVLLTTPLPLALSLLGSLVWPLLLTLAEITSLLAVSVAVLHLQVHAPLFGYAAVAFILGLIPNIGLALADAGFVLLFKRSSPSMMVLGSAANLLGGILYPIEVLPLPLFWLAQLLPVSHVANMLRYSLTSPSPQSVLLNVAALAALGVAYLGCGSQLFRLALRYARIQGSIGQY